MTIYPCHSENKIYRLHLSNLHRYTFKMFKIKPALCLIIFQTSNWSVSVFNFIENNQNNI